MVVAYGGPAGGDGGLAGGGGGTSAFADDGELDGEPRFSKAWSFIKIFCSKSESGSCCLTSCRWGGDGPAAGAGGGIGPAGSGGGIGPTDGGGPAGGDGGLAGGGGAPPGGASAFADDGELDGEPPPHRHNKNHSHLPQQPATMDIATVKTRTTANIIVILKGVARINPLFYTNSLRNLWKLTLNYYS